MKKIANTGFGLLQDIIAELDQVDSIRCFFAALFLARDQKVDLEQQEDDIKIILMKEDKIFEYIPIETLIKDNQQQYYEVLRLCDKAGESTLFIEFMLGQIRYAINSYNENILSNVTTPHMRLEYARDYFVNRNFSRKEYILLHKDISTATASRDLKYAVEQKALQKIGDKNQSFYRFKNY